MAVSISMVLKAFFSNEKEGEKKLRRSNNYGRRRIYSKWMRD